MVLVEGCCRSCKNDWIVKQVMIQDNVILGMEDLTYPEYLLISECSRWPNQPARKTSSKHVLSNMNARGKRANGVGYVSIGRGKAIHTRFVDFHVVQYGPEIKPYPLQVPNNEFNMAKQHVDRT